ncbi:MAG TPA: tyrosine--tRNA ligase [Alphaproteobacteria bacterium]|nr:tyrosine--tRNA ligase [Alphaproteobacteria bacterium]
MTRLTSGFLQLLSERGYIHQCTDMAALDAACAKGPITAYIGFDATADSLHVGNLVGIMLLRRLQQTGHKPIVLMGGGTTKVGDPSGKDETRQLLTDAQINANIASIKTIFGNFLTFGSGKSDAVMVNNDEWLGNLSYISFLREVGRHFTINRMLTFDSVKMRLEREQPLTFLEFNYMIMQGYDFVELQKRYGCVLQMGGSDQWGNIVNGVELGRRMRELELFGLTTPLITTSSGAKMGKTAAGAVWLKQERLKAYDYWQFWRNTEDADVGRFLKLFTDVPMDEIAKLEKLKDAEINEAKKTLAFEATKLAHGEAAAKLAADTAKEMFEGGGKSANLPTFEFPRASNPAVIDMIVAVGFAASRGEAKRLIEQGGLKLNDQPVTSLTATISAGDLDKDGTARLSVGKKRHAVAKAI